MSSFVLKNDSESNLEIQGLKGRKNKTEIANNKLCIDKLSLSDLKDDNQDIESEKLVDTQKEKDVTYEFAKNLDENLNYHAEETPKELLGYPEVSFNTMRIPKSNSCVSFPKGAEKLIYTSPGKKQDNGWKRKSLESSISTESSILEVYAKYLGRIVIKKCDLTAEKSPKSVNDCINKLSPQGFDILKEDSLLILEDKYLKVLKISEENYTEILMNSESIHTLRVWGVGRNDCNDFAYVSKDTTTGEHYCYVFRCNRSARIIANTLRDMCSRVLVHGKSQDSYSKSLEEPMESSLQKQPSSSKLVTKVVPTPKSLFALPKEPKKFVSAYYLGSKPVNKSTGMEVLNESIKSLSDECPRSEWEQVLVSVAPSTISISFSKRKRDSLEYRIRFLSFLGIGINPSTCAFIVHHPSNDTFVCHVFVCEPDAGFLCKTIEAACKLRYQKVLDARPINSENAIQQQTTDSVKSKFKNMLDSLAKKSLEGGTS